MFLEGSNLDTIIFAAPLLYLLLTFLFRVFEMCGKTWKVAVHVSTNPGLDANGLPVCMDPDQALPRVIQSRTL
ncbi:hypothetical protein ACFPT7_17915 [Acidicapsa dinghuensis]|uniref:Uncharacterized protein n=1 Tax=Acidicapsa dinghuensis TaxID=2218256 RepID=A0ABW1EIQ4_9BACT|nr:hypothetical protein [Acidicapsa dinghuensis]